MDSSAGFLETRCGAASMSESFPSNCTRKGNTNDWIVHAGILDRSESSQNIAGQGPVGTRGFDGWGGALGWLDRDCCGKFRDVPGYFHRASLQQPCHQHQLRQRALIGSTREPSDVVAAAQT